MASKSKSSSSASGGSSSSHHHRHHHDRHHHGHGPSDSLAINVGLDDEDLVVDSEWADFDRLLTEYRLRRRINTGSPSPLVSRRDLHELMGEGRPRGKVSQAFYPCPAPAAGTDPDDMDYVHTAVRRGGFAATLSATLPCTMHAHMSILQQSCVITTI